MFGSQIRDKDGVAATVSLSCDEWLQNEFTHFTPFLAHIRGNGCLAATIWADSARVFGPALPDIRVLSGKRHRCDVPSRS
jgi:hypothetical protein